MSETKIEVSSTDQKASDRLSALIPLTNKENPKPEDLAELRELFKETPQFALEIGNQQKIVFEGILAAAAGKTAIRREAIKIYVEKMKDKLGYSSSTSLEQMLIDEITMRWIRLQHIENVGFIKCQEAHSIEVGMYYDKLLETSHKRYLRAVETLGKVRKMIAQTQMRGAKMYKDLLTAKDEKPDKTDT